MQIDTASLILSSRDTVTAFIRRSDNGSSVAGWTSALMSFLTLVVAGFAAFQWRNQYSTQQWGKTVELLLKYPRFYTSAGNLDYRKYTDLEKATYELVARSSIAYLDDAYHLGMRADLADWLKGSVEVFAYPHRAWFRDNKCSYETGFFYFIDREISAIESRRI